MARKGGRKQGGTLIYLNGENYGVLTFNKNIFDLPKKKAAEIISMFGTFDKMRRHRKPKLIEKLKEYPKMTDELIEDILGLIKIYNHSIKDEIHSSVKRHFDENRNAEY